MFHENLFFFHIDPNSFPHENMSFLNTYSCNKKKELSKTNVVPRTLRNAVVPNEDCFLSKQNKVCHVYRCCFSMTRLICCCCVCCFFHATPAYVAAHFVCKRQRQRGNDSACGNGAKSNRTKKCLRQRGKDQSNQKGDRACRVAACVGVCVCCVACVCMRVCVCGWGCVSV